MSWTSNSSHACGTGVSAGHSLVPKHDSAAWASGHTANVLAPFTSSACRYSPSSTLNRMPSASSYRRRDSATLEVIGPKPAMRSTFMVGFRSVSLDEVLPTRRQLVRVWPEVRYPNDLVGIVQIEEAKAWLSSAVRIGEIDPACRVLSIPHGPNDSEMPVSFETLNV